MLNYIIMGLWFCVWPLILHEFGHWIILKYYKIPYKFYINWKAGGIIAFEVSDVISKDDLIKNVHVGLAGAFPPLLIFLPILLFPELRVLVVFFICCFTCLFYCFWSISETWLNLRNNMS